MSLVPGTRIGPYNIVGLIGAGGMGEVFRARDTRLDRDVAIKILPQAFADDIGRRERFGREARTVAALSHGNIVSVFDTGVHDQHIYVVMELLEGQTLREALSAGMLPVRKALDIAVQVARGLAAAHDKGLVHRDLKPENVFLLDDGRVKILDFGLAKLTAEPTTTPTEAKTALAHTDPGTVMGTVGYMAPEQVRGQAVDARTDLFALGAVLYEMLSGRRAFQAETTADTLFVIVKDDPPALSASRSAIAPALERIVRHCLEKQAGERFQSARDVAFALDALSGSGTSSTPAVQDAPKADPRSGRLPFAPVLTGAVVLVAAALAAGVWWATPQRHWPTRWIGEDLGGPPKAWGPRISPNGQDLAFVAMVNNQTQVALMKPGSGSWSLLTSDRTRGSASSISWTLDGTRLMLTRTPDGSGSVYSVPVPAGAESLALREASAALELPGGDLIVLRVNEQRLPQLFRYGKSSQAFDPLDAILPSQWANARVSPDGTTVVFYGRPAGQPGVVNHLYAVDLASGRTRRLAPGVEIRWTISFGEFPLAVTADWVLFNLASGDLHQIVAAPLDGSDNIETLFSTTLEPVYLDVAPDGAIYLDQVSMPGGFGRFSPRDGTLQFEEVVNRVGPSLALPGAGKRVLQTVRIAGAQRLMVFAPGQAPQPFAPTLATEDTQYPMTALGPDRVAFVKGRAGRRTVVIASAADGLVVRDLTSVNANDVEGLAGSPDGRTIYYLSARHIWAVSSDGGDSRRIREGDGVAIDPAGQYLVVKVNERTHARLIHVPLNGTPEHDIQIQGDARIALVDGLAPNAVGPGGRIAVRAAPIDSWFWPLGILDPATGLLTLPAGKPSDDHWMMGWTDDGEIVMTVNTARGRLWRFTPMGAGR